MIFFIANLISHKPKEALLCYPESSKTKKSALSVAFNAI